MTKTKTKKLTGRALTVAVAKDCLKLLQFVTPTCGTYLSVTNPKFFRRDGYGCLRLKANTHTMDARKVIEEVAQDCHVCGIGLAFLGYVACRDKATVGDCHTLNSIEMRERMAEAFSPKQLSLIEAYFEGWYSEHTESYDAPVEFAKAHPNPRERLQIIFQNIVDNNGEFKP
jgi:hypothetical protein